jgi:3-hydroxyisobutyrate dehydrogenase-like beta-hydroxyacid dehydrogenase
MKIAVLGLGRMGRGIASSVLRTGYDLVVWNRTRDAADALLRGGATWAVSPREAAADCDIACTMLADDHALDAVLDGESGLVAGLPVGKLHVSLSTVSPSAAAAAADKHAALGQRFVAAGAFGRPDRAANGTLSVVAAGDSGDLDGATPLFDAIAQRVFRVGATPAMACLAKLCGNFMLFATVEAIAEAMTLAERGGIARETLQEVLLGTNFDSIAQRVYGAILVERRFQPAGFPVVGGLKDIHLAGEAAESLRVAMPVLGIVRDRMLASISHGHGDLDWSAIALMAARDAGIYAG